MLFYIERKEPAIQPQPYSYWLLSALIVNTHLTEERSGLSGIMLRPEYHLDARSKILGLKVDQYIHFLCTPSKRDQNHYQNWMFENFSAHKAEKCRLERDRSIFQLGTVE